MPKEDLAELLDCGMLSCAPSLKSLEQVISPEPKIQSTFSCGAGVD
jgi:hypothetical protein